MKEKLIPRNWLERANKLAFSKVGHWFLFPVLLNGKETLVGDDVRQDMMALQVIEYCKRVFDKQHLDVFLFPYKVIATHPNEGIIEVVPDSQSRDQLGKKSDGNLFHWFLTKYGTPNTHTFQNARDCFVKSMAAYSVVS
jgi:phosphatidylinositol 4-kinase